MLVTYSRKTRFRFYEQGVSPEIDGESFVNTFLKIIMSDLSYERKD
jgi:hypothetical protein